MALKEEDDDKDLKQGEQGEQDGELVIVEEPPQAQQQEDERVAQNVNEDDDEDGPNAATEAEREARRLERRARKEREKAAKERNRKELEFLRKRNEVLERRFSAVEQRQMQSEAAIVDGRISNYDDLIRQAEQVYAQAISNQKGDDAAEAMRIRDQLRSERDRFVGYKQHLAQQAQQAAQPPQQQEERQQQPQIEREAPSPELLGHAEKWMKSNPWYKPGGQDEASAIVTAIDSHLANEGYDPETEEYWQELSARVAKRLPEHASRAAAGGRQNGGGPAMANGGRAAGGNLKPGEIYISPERKQALIDAGVWDDPKLRQRYVRRYAQYDQENGGNRRSS